MAISKLTLKQDGRYFVTTKDTVQTYVNIRASYSTSSAVIAKLRKGDFLLMKETAYNDGSFRWYGVETLDGLTGYAREDNVKTVYVKNDAPTNAQAQSLIDGIIENDKQIYESVLLIANLIEGQKKNGCNVSKYEAQLKELNEKLAYRQAGLKNTHWFEKVKSTASKVWDKMKAAYNSLLSYVSGIGAVPVAVIAVVAVASLLAGSTVTIAAYYSLKPKYDESKADLLQTKELKEAVEKLSPEKGKKLVEDLEKQIDDAYNQGKEDGKFSGIGAVLKPLAIGALGFVLVTKFIDSQKKK